MFIILFLSFISIASACNQTIGFNLISAGNYTGAKTVFNCIITTNPYDFIGYVGLAESQLMLDDYINAQETYIAFQGIALYNNPSGYNNTIDFYDYRFEINPNDKSALRGSTFFNWVFFNYLDAISTADALLRMDKFDKFANAFKASSLALYGADLAKADGLMSISEAKQLLNPSIHWVDADYQVYGRGRFVLAFLESNAAISLGADSFRLRAIQALCLINENKPKLAAEQASYAFNTKIKTLNTVSSNSSTTCNLVYQGACLIKMYFNKDSIVDISTSSDYFYDTIMYVKDPLGEYVTYNDDQIYGVDFYARVVFTAAISGIYTFNVTTFDALGTGLLNIIKVV